VTTPDFQSAGNEHSAVPPILKDLAEAFSEHAKAANRLWLTAVGVALFVLPRLYEPIKSDNPYVELPWDLGKVPPHIFYVVAVLLLSIILTAFSSAHAQMVRAHRLSNEALRAHGSPVVGAVDMRDIVDVLRLSSFLRLAPLAQAIRGGDRQFFHQPKPSPRVAWLSAVYYAVLKVFGAFVYFAFPAGALGFTWHKFETTPDAVAAAGCFFTWGVRALSFSALVALLAVLLVELRHMGQVFLRIGEQQRPPPPNSGLQQTRPSLSLGRRS